jgi:dUTP pyrophosphatase
MSDKNTLARIATLETLVDELTSKPKVKFKRLHPDAVVPQYKTAGAAGADLVACNEEPITLWPEGVIVVPLGFAIELPPGYEAQVRPRSGLALRGVSVANSPGTVDSDFSGCVGVILRNLGETLVIHKGDRIAQMVICRAAQAEFEVVDELSDTARGTGGFGSTGLRG